MERVEPQVPEPTPEEGGALRDALASSDDGAALVYFRRFFRSGDRLEKGVDGAPLTEFTIIRLVGDQMDIGHHPECEVVIDWDPAVGRAHAQLKKAGVDWYVDNLDRVNGTLVNGERVDLAEEHFVSDGDQIRVGDTVMVFCQPTLEPAGPPVKMQGVGEPPALSEKQRNVLIELVRPKVEHGPDAPPAGNDVIAERLTLEEETIRGHMRNLFGLFGLSEVPRGRKREMLATMAIDLGMVTRNDLG